MAKLYKRGPVWWAWIKGERVSTKCRHRKTAEARARELELRAEDPASAAAHTTTLDTGCANFLEQRRMKGCAARTIQYYREKSGHLVRLLGGETKLAAVTAKVVDQYLKVRHEEGAHPHTIKKEMIALRGVLKVAKRRGEFASDIDAILPVGLSPQYEPRKRFLRPEELDRLLAELAPERAAHVAFIVATGARAGEAKRAGKADVDLGRWQVRVHGTKTEKAAQVVPVAPMFRPLLERALRDAPGSAPLFRPWLNIRRDLHLACEKARVPKVTPNDLRRTTSQWLRQSGLDAATVAEVLRHVDARMVERVYGKLSADDLGKMLERAQAPVQEPASPYKKRTDGGGEGENSAGNGSAACSGSSPSKPVVAGSNPAGRARKAEKQGDTEFHGFHVVAPSPPATVQKDHSGPRERWFRALSWAQLRRVA